MGGGHEQVGPRVGPEDVVPGDQPRGLDPIFEAALDEGVLDLLREEPA
jgi:hypothetical protein